MTPVLRPLGPGDAASVLAVFRAAIAGTALHYSPAQRRAWAAGLPDMGEWRARLARLEGVLAEVDGMACGFMALGDGGYLDMAYVRPEVARQGLGRTLHDAVCDIAAGRGVPEMTTHASLAARPFFEALGWQVTAAETVQRDGQALRRFAMRRDL